MPPSMSRAQPQAGLPQCSRGMTAACGTPFMTLICDGGDCGKLKHAAVVNIRMMPIGDRTIGV